MCAKLAENGFTDTTRITDICMFFTDMPNIPATPCGNNHAAGTSQSPTPPAYTAATGNLHNRVFMAQRFEFSRKNIIFALYGP